MSDNFDWYDIANYVNDGQRPLGCPTRCYINFQTYIHRLVKGKHHTHINLSVDRIIEKAKSFDIFNITFQHANINSRIQH